jgi:hypothetical protein
MIRNLDDYQEMISAYADEYNYAINHIGNLNKNF